MWGRRSKVKGPIEFKLSGKGREGTTRLTARSMASTQGCSLEKKEIVVDNPVNRLEDLEVEHYNWSTARSTHPRRLHRLHMTNLISDRLPGWLLHGASRPPS